MEANAAGFVRHSKSEFLESFESGELQAQIIDYLQRQGIDPEAAEQRSWNNSYAFMDIVLRDDRIPADIEVICECGLGAFGKRADMVLVSPPGDCDENDMGAENAIDVNSAGNAKRRAIVIELKQWDKFHLATHKDVRDPAAQAAEYKRLFRQVAGELGVVEVLSCAYLHNVAEDDYRTLLDRPATQPQADAQESPARREAREKAAREATRLFFQGDTEALRSYIMIELADDACSTTQAIKRAKENGYWDDSLPDTAGLFRNELISHGLARSIPDEPYDHEPTFNGRRLGIRKFNGYDMRNKRAFTSCSFTDAAMRNVICALLG